MRSRLRVSIGVILGLIVSAESARAAEYYYAIVFGSQSQPKVFRYTHTWATHIKLSGEGPDLNSYALEVNTISWLPRTLDVHVWDPRPEPGTNLDLQGTINAVYAHNENITAWGPFITQKAVYDRSLAVAQKLNSGEAQYRAISGRSLLISDCIHAVAAVDSQFGRGHYPLIRVGKPASRYIARQVVLRSVFDQSSYDNSWLISRLGLDRYPIEVIAPSRIPDHGCVLCKLPE